MNRLASIAAAVAVVLGFALAPASPAAAAPPRIEITKVYYNSPGADKGSNASLNDEWVRLTNRRTSAINLKGWMLRDKAKHIYTFKTTFKLQPGKHVYIRTGKGTDSTKNRYWGRSWYVWNNSGDKAYLRNASGTLIDSCSWGSSGSYTYCR
jgi:hypothetical protein